MSQHDPADPHDPVPPCDPVPPRGLDFQHDRAPWRDPAPRRGASQICWTAQSIYDRAYANQVLEDSGGYSPLPATADVGGNVPDTVTYEAIKAHCKSLGIDCSQIAGV